MVTAVVGDGTGEMQMTWFNPFVERQLRTGHAYAFSGKVDNYRHVPVIRNPQFEPLDRNQLSTGRLAPVYPLTEGISVQLAARGDRSHGEVVRGRGIRLPAGRGAPERRADAAGRGADADPLPGQSRAPGGRPPPVELRRVLRPAAGRPGRAQALPRDDRPALTLRRRHTGCVPRRTPVRDDRGPAPRPQSASPPIWRRPRR